MWVVGLKCMPVAGKCGNTRWNSDPVVTHQRGRNFVVEEDRAPVELTGSVALLDGASMIIGYGAELQQSTITVQQGGVLILDGSTVKGDSVTFSVGNINLNGGKLC